MVQEAERYRSEDERNKARKAAAAVLCMPLPLPPGLAPPTQTLEPNMGSRFSREGGSLIELPGCNPPGRHRQFRHRIRKDLGVSPSLCCLQGRGPQQPGELRILRPQLHERRQGLVKAGPRGQGDDRGQGQGGHRLAGQEHDGRAGRVRVPAQGEGPSPASCGSLCRYPALPRRYLTHPRWGLRRCTHRELISLSLSARYPAALSKAVSNAANPCGERHQLPLLPTNSTRRSSSR